MVHPNSRAAVSRNCVGIVVDSKLCASQFKHFCMSAFQSIAAALKNLYDGLSVPFFSVVIVGGGFGVALVVVMPLWFMMSRSTDVLKARTCALGCERHRIVAGRRH